MDPNSQELQDPDTRVLATREEEEEDEDLQTCRLAWKVAGTLSAVKSGAKNGQCSPENDLNHQFSIAKIRLAR